MVQEMVTSIPGPDVYCAGAPETLEIFATSSCQILVKTKKCLTIMSAGFLALCHLVNLALVIALRS